MAPGQVLAYEISENAIAPKWATIYIAQNRIAIADQISLALVLPAVRLLRGTA